MTKIHPGALRHGLILETPVRSNAEAGGADTVWSQVAVVWASLRPTSGRETVDADGVGSRVTHTAHIRWRPDISAAHRFRDGTRIYLIHAVRDPDDRRRRLACLVEEQAL
jgi:SPP1 family predicted phage head-tail adaptor